MEDSTDNQDGLAARAMQEQRSLIHQQQQLDMLLRQLAKSESRYQDLGLTYYSIAEKSRPFLIQDEGIHDCFLSSRESPAPLVNEINILRKMTQQTAEHIHRSEPERAEATSIAASLALEDIISKLERAKAVLEEAAEHVDEEPEAWGPRRLPQPEEETQYGPLRDWALSLPAIHDMIHEGSFTAEEALQKALRTNAVDPLQNFNPREGLQGAWAFR